MHRFGRGTERDGQNTGGEWIECPAVPSFLRVEGAFDAIDDVGGGEAGGFIDNEPAVERAAFGFAACHGVRGCVGKGGGVWLGRGAVNGRMVRGEGRRLNSLREKTLKNTRHGAKPSW